MKKIVTLKINEDRRILNGHLWAFSNEVKTTSGDPLPGDIIELQSNNGKFIGLGFYNPHSLIAVRLLTIGQDDIDFEFFRKRIETAHVLREKMYKGTYRLIHGEGDFLPGLIIDRYNDYFSIQTLSLGMDKRLTLVCDVLESLFHPSGIVERNESAARIMEGLEQRKGVLRGSAKPTIIEEYGIRYTVDLLRGQKTGFFLDQRENRRAFRRYAGGAEVLDCFCNDGGFALHAAYGGAAKVLGIDSSDNAVQQAKANAKLNKISTANFSEKDAFQFLKQSVSEGKQFDLINLDPPSFAKSKKNISEAKQGYREIHTYAFKLLKEGGVLSTSSCSHNITEETFIDIVNTTARRLGRKITMLEWHGAAPDHPVLPAMPETAYLKYGIFLTE